MIDKVVDNIVSGNVIIIIYTADDGDENNERKPTRLIGVKNINDKKQELNAMDKEEIKNKIKSHSCRSKIKPEQRIKKCRSVCN